MKNSETFRLFIAGGYGMVGSNIAELARKYFPNAEIFIAGRNPEKGQLLAEKLGNAYTVKFDLEDDKIPEEAIKSDMIITAFPDPYNLLGELAVKHNIAFINITSGSGDDILPLLSLCAIHKPTRPIVPLGYYETGLFLPLVHQLSDSFQTIEEVTMTALHDPADPLGEQTQAELTAEPIPAFIRLNRLWTRSGTERKITLSDGTITQSIPFGTLDIPAVSAMTGAKSVQEYVASGISMGSYKNGLPSIDLYVDIKGVDLSGIRTTKRIIASDNQGHSHFTAFGVIVVIDAILNSDKSGLRFFEELVDYKNAIQMIKAEGISIIV